MMIHTATQVSYLHSKLCSGVQSLHLAKNFKIRPLYSGDIFREYYLQFRKEGRFGTHTRSE